MNEYKPRVMDTILARKLKGKGAVLLEGAKWCGKTTTAKQISKSFINLSQTGTQGANVELASINPKIALEGETPHLIDEWQLVPQIWDAVRNEVDDRGGKFGQFILTGSSVPPSFENIHHTGTGRIARIKMRPMSLLESGDSSGEVSLKSLFDGSCPQAMNGSEDIKHLAFLICRGGWPLSLTEETDVALQQANDYVDAIKNYDASAVDGIHRSSRRVEKLLQIYARYIGSQVKMTAIQSELTASDTGASIVTIASYIDALRRIFVIEDMGSWNPNLRSKAAISSGDTRYFTDPSIATASLGLGPDDLINDLNTMGLFLENLCVRDLRVYAQAIDGEVLHFRNRNGLECDAVIHLRNGSYGLVEIKLGGANAIEAGAKTLNKISSLVDTDKMKMPAFKMILTGLGKYAYVRSDGVFVVPVTTLGV